MSLEVLSDEDIFLRSNILIQVITEIIQSGDHPGDATRQLRIIGQEMCRRKFFLQQLDEIHENQVTVRYQMLDQLFSGWPETPNVEELWRAVIIEMQSREMIIPERVIKVKPLVFIGSLNRKE